MPELTLRQWNALIERWNKMRQTNRRERIAQCAAFGHDWAAYPLPGRVCRRCLAYAAEGGERAA